MNSRPKTISKLLSMNDIGVTGGHQAGMLIPKGGDVLRFFPELDSSIKNPRSAMYFTDQSGKIWKFNFIYYNNKSFGGTRNEYRLTGMTAFFREANLKHDDEIILTRENDRLFISYKRHNSINVTGDGTRVVLNISSGWKVIDY